ncbi:MAG: hypothetical protein ACLTZH_11535 [Subdoligranulum sp.]
MAATRSGLPCPTAKRGSCNGRTEAALKAAVRLVQAQDEAGLEVGDHTLVGEWAKSGRASTSRVSGSATTKMYRDACNLHIMQRH